MILDPDERMGLFHLIEGKKLLNVNGLDGSPMVHHYSWVRTKEEMKKKTRCWGHHWERDWESLIENEYSKDFTGKDFIRGYEYILVDPFFDPLKTPSENILDATSFDQHLINVKQLDNVKRVSAQEVFRMDLYLKFEL